MTAVHDADLHHEPEVAGAAPGETPDVAFPVLDTLRAVGALAVLTTHVAFWAGDYTEHAFWGTLLARMDVGVALFFVLSGFLLSRGWVSAALDRTPRPRTGRYLWKRLLRIAPLYLLAALLALTFIDQNADRTPGQWVVTLLLLDTFTDSPDPAGLTHMWSLAVEVTFYLVLPLVMWAAVGGRRFSPWRAGGVLVAMVALACWWHLHGGARVGEHTTGNVLQWLPAFTGWFAVGIGLALVRELHVRGRASRLTEPVVSLALQPGCCWALAGGLLLLSATPLAGPSLLAAPTPAESLTKSLLYAAVGGLVVCTGVFTRPGAYRRALSHPAARHVGVISYGIFALHLPVLHLVMHVTGWTLFDVGVLPLWLLTVAVSLVVAEAAYRVVERPALRLKNLGRSRRREPDTTTETSTASSSS